MKLALPAAALAFFVALPSPAQELQCGAPPPPGWADAELKGAIERLKSAPEPDIRQQTVAVLLKAMRLHPEVGAALQSLYLDAALCARLAADPRIADKAGRRELFRRTLASVNEQLQQQAQQGWTPEQLERLRQQQQQQSQAYHGGDYQARQQSRAGDRFDSFIRDQAPTAQPAPPPPDPTAAGLPVTPKSATAAAPPLAYKVHVFFGTDRAPQPAQPGHDIDFGGERGSGIAFGAVDVSIPPNHKLGTIERPATFLSFSMGEDLAKHIVIVKTTQLDAAAFFAQVADAAARRPKPSRSFIFIHGYNVGFQDAALRTAQLSVDLDPDAVPVFYSWPSQDSTGRYTIDEQNIEWSEPNLRSFLETYADRSPSQEIVVIAHSMGTRAATRALSALLERRADLRARYKELILAAPDIDAQVFVRDLMPAYQATQTPVTLYASSKDKALLASKEVHGFARAGESGPNLVLAPGLDTIDASAVDTDFLGHSYAVGTRPLLTDMVLIEREHWPASRRPSLSRIEAANGSFYWRFNP